MPLRLVTRPGSSILYIRGTVRGQSLFESTGTADPVRAEGLRAKREAELWDRSIYGARAVVSFAHAVNAYLEAEERSEHTKGLVKALLLHFGTAPLGTINQDAVDQAYGKLLTAKAGPATRLRAVLTPLRAILEHAAIRGWCARPAFQTPRQPRIRTPVLRPAEATALVQAASPHLRPLLVFLLGTGCRLSEALELDWPAVDLRAARCLVIQKGDRERHVDLPPVAVAALSALPHREGRVFRPSHHGSQTRMGKAYRDTGRSGGGQIKTAWASACARAGLPGEWREWLRPDRPGKSWRRYAPAFTPHDLRHTWASWQYCVHRDLIALRDRGGWETTKMVERYTKPMSATYREEIEAWWRGGAISVQPTEIQAQSA